MHSLVLIAIVSAVLYSSYVACTPQSEEVKCLVCYSVIDEIQANITKTKPKLKTNVGGYQLDNEGNMQSKQVLYSHSTLHLSEVMDNVCNVMEDYVKAVDKKTGELIIMPLVINGAMNPRMGEVDMIQDPDLNKNIKYYCEDEVKNRQLIDEGTAEHGKVGTLRVRGRHHQDRRSQGRG
uniref:Protein canopy homolog 2 n=1 Tax=Cacopsylla melanoneura TaxID=428564 RepID=A0A8D8YJA4_9HEMI